jgi:ribosomal-protein-alanine N-acetyltransferase
LKSLIKTEPFQKSDVEAILRIQTESNLSCWKLQDYYDEIQRQDSASFTAKKEKKVIGFVLARLITTEINISSKDSNFESGVEAEAEIEIYNLAVDKKYRKEGVGTLLIQKAIQTVVTNHITSIWLEVRESNSAAILFYKKNKFKEIYRRKNFYSYPQEDALVMKLDFFDVEKNSQKIAKTET